MKCYHHKHVIFLVLLSATLVLLTSCSCRRTAATLDDVETYIQSRPDSALAVIRAIDTTTLTTRSVRAQYALLHSIALDKNWIDTTDVNVVMPAVEYYDRHPSGLYRAKAYYYLGRIQENGGDLSAASVSLVKSEKYAEGTDDIAFKSLLYQTISNIYGKVFQMDEALDYTEKSYELALQDGNSLGANASLYCMAKDLNNMGRFSEADSIYRLLLEREELDPHLVPSVKCGYALLQVTYNEDYEQAVKIFEEAIREYGSLRSSNHWGAYAYALLRIGEKERSDSIFKQMESSGAGRSLSFCWWKSRTDAFTGNYEAAYILNKESFDKQLDNVRTLLKQSVLKAQNDYLELSGKVQAHDAQKRKVINCLVILSLVLLFAVLWLLNRRYSERIEQERDSLLASYEVLRNKVDLIEEEKLSVRNQYIQLCQAHFSNIGRINEMLSVHSSHSNSSLYKEFKKSFNQVKLDEENQQVFEEMLNASFDNVMTHFRETFPGKLPKYYRLVSFFIAGFDTTTIVMIIQDYNKHNVHVEKSRLKAQINKLDSPYREQFERLIL